MERRNAVKAALLGSISGIVVSHKEWSKPVLNSIVLPAHAQTSTSCSGFTNSAINETLNLSVNTTQVSGPIIVSRSGNGFEGIQTRIIGQCRSTDDLSVEVNLSGSIDSSNNSISGELIITQRCGNDLVSTQNSSFTVNQSPISASDEGDYTGSLTVTLRRCNDF